MSDKIVEYGAFGKLETQENVPFEYGSCKNYMAVECSAHLISTSFAVKSKWG